MEDNKELDIIIHYQGDESVGIFPITYTLENVLVIEGILREHLREATVEYFETYIIGEKVNVMFSDELPSD